MSRVVIVTSGEYPDYSIDRVFSTEEKAKEWVEVITSMYGGNYNIEQYELDAPIPERKEYLFFLKPTSKMMLLLSLTLSSILLMGRQI